MGRPRPPCTRHYKPVEAVGKLCSPGESAADTDSGVKTQHNKNIISEAANKHFSQIKSNPIFCFATSLDPHMRKQHVRGRGEPVESHRANLKHWKMIFFEWVVVQQKERDLETVI